MNQEDEPRSARGNKPDEDEMDLQEWFNFSLQQIDEKLNENSKNIQNILYEIDMRGIINENIANEVSFSQGQIEREQHLNKKLKR